MRAYYRYSTLIDWLRTSSLLGFNILLWYHNQIPGKDSTINYSNFYNELSWLEHRQKLIQIDSMNTMKTSFVIKEATQMNSSTNITSKLSNIKYSKPSHRFKHSKKQFTRYSSHLCDSAELIRSPFQMIGILNLFLWTQHASVLLVL